VKTYWDSSALIHALSDHAVKERLIKEGGVTRSHSFSEIFSTLTGGRLGVRVKIEDAVKMIEGFSKLLKVVEIKSNVFLSALGQAKSKGVRGGRVYDYIHAVVAVEHGCDQIYTANVKDFVGLFDNLEIKAP
jgi:predicted nucleic acid-binding protein